MVSRETQQEALCELRVRCRGCHRVGPCPVAAQSGSTLRVLRCRRCGGLGEIVSVELVAPKRSRLSGRLTNAEVFFGPLPERNPLVGRNDRLEQSRRRRLVGGKY